jgi:imidazole glycerol-phosphate synthase subunit HisH
VTAAPSVVVVDHGSGNLRSAQRALSHVGGDVVVTADMRLAAAADGVVLPGVGAFLACMTGIRSIGADRMIAARVAAGRPVLGICVGMQVLFDAGAEHGVHTAGIGLLPGGVVRLEAPVLPHLGWNTVQPPASSVLFAGLADERFYFVHSYAAKPLDDAAGKPAGDGETITVHGEPFVSAIERDGLSATQFHPEKSGEAGLALLRNWLVTLT